MQPKTQNRLQFLINLAYFSAIGFLGYLGLRYVLGWVLPFIIAFGIVSIVNPVINFVNGKLKINHKTASIVVMIFVYGFTAFLLFELVIQVYYVLRNLFTELPAYYETSIAPTIANVGAHVDSWVTRLPDSWVNRFEGLQTEIMSAVQTFLLSFSQSGMSLITRMAGQVPNFMIAFLFTIMLSFFIGAQYTAVTGLIKAQLPDRAKTVLTDLRVIVNDIVLRYVSAIIKLMSITFVELSIGLLVLRTQNAIPIAFGIAVFDALPFVGTGAIMIPWTLIEAIQGNLTYALGIGILYAVITVVRNIIEPHVVGKKLGLNPIVSIVSIYLGYKLIGILGMIVMPIVTQILLELHKRGIIKVLRTSEKAAPNMEEGKPEEEK